MPGAQSETVHQLKISLAGTTPPMWRRIQVSSVASLGFLHSVIQEAFGWEGAHLHCFRDKGQREWGDRAFSDDSYAAAFADEEEAGLGQVLPAEGAVLWYDYDFGDDWQHRIEVEKVLPLEPGLAYPRCTGGRRAAAPAEDIGGTCGLEEIAYLIAHPEADPPEHFKGLVCQLRDEGYDPAAFDPAELTTRLSGLKVRTVARAARVPAPAPGNIKPEVFPAVTLPPLADLAAQAGTAPLIGDALRLADWCAAGRPVTPKGVLKPAVAREAVEELRLWQRDETLTDPSTRADFLGGLGSAGDLPVLDSPWQCAAKNGLIAIRSGRAFPGPRLPSAGDTAQLLSSWQDAFDTELSALDSMGARVLPEMLRMLAGNFDSVVFPVLKLLYRLPGEEWLDTGTLLSALGSAAGEPAPSFLDVFAIESTARLLKILSAFGAAEVDWGATPWGADDALATLLGDSSAAPPCFRGRLTALGRYGIRNGLVSQGHTARIAGELAAADAATLLDALSYDKPAAFSTELTGWLAGRDENSAVTQLLGAVAGTDLGLAGRRVAAIRALTEAKPGDALKILRDTAASGPDWRRHVAAGALTGLGEEPPCNQAESQQWLLIDRLAALHASGWPEILPQDVLQAIGAQADDLWRGGHPAATETMEATAAAVRDSDKILAKRLRRSAHKARAFQ